MDRAAPLTTSLRRDGLPDLPRREVWRLLRDVALPTLAKGIIIRRKPVVAVADRFELNRRAVDRLSALRDRYGPGPLRFRVGGRRMALILDADHARAVLAATPTPYSPATKEKRAALGQFEPGHSLISDPPERAPRRALHDDLLESGCPVHSQHPRFAAVIEAEMAALLEGRSVLHWPAFQDAWFRAVRRIVLGDGARDDAKLTDMLTRLRGAANWSVLLPRRRVLRARFLERLTAHLGRAEPDSLAARVAAYPAKPVVEPAAQVAHWLFAFDAAAMATFRALALMATHSELGADPGLLRATIRESVRLWPTTPMILRETRERVPFPRGALEADTLVLIHVPFFHRDRRRSAYADRFAPELWLEEEGAGLPLFGFSAGPGLCPAHQLVPLVGGDALAALLRRGPVQLLDRERLVAHRPMPASLDPFTLRFRFG